MANKVMTQKLRLGLLMPFVITLVFNISIASADRRVPSHVLKSASELDYPPFALVRPDGSADGFSVALLKAVVNEMRMEVEIPVAPWHEIKQQLVDGALDVLPLVSYSPERDKVFDFTVPYLRMHGAIFVRKGNRSIRSKLDLKGKDVLVMRGDTAHEYAVRENLTDKLVLVDSFAEAMKLLANGKHEAVVAQHLMGLQLINKLKINNIVSISPFVEASLKPTAGPLAGFEQKFCFAVHEGDTELLSTLNEGLSIVIANGTYDRLYNKWFEPILPQPSVSPAQIFKYLIITFIPILLLIAGIGLWYLKKEVARKTIHLNEEITERKHAEEVLLLERNKLQEALAKVRLLSGFIPICASCKNIRDDKGFWNQVEAYITQHSEVKFSHGICPECAKKLYPELNNK